MIWTMIVGPKLCCSLKVIKHIMCEHVVTPYHTETEEWDMFMIEPPPVFPFHITAGILDLRACQALGTKQ
jgi:hypothetical protein